MALRYGVLDQMLDQRGKFISECAAESKDCTVIAMSIALGIPYDVSHKMLADAGRVPHNGFHLVSWLRGKARINDGMLYGYKITHVSVPRLTLAQVVRDFPKGRFILRMKRHAFCLIDGKVHDYDYSTGRSRILDMFLLERA
jgi:hypothetical protein